MLLILDASVVVKWFKQETLTEKAIEIREQFLDGLHEIVAPDLLLYEIANVLKYEKKFTENIIENIIDSLFEMDVVFTIPSEHLLKDSLKIANKYNTSVYDAIYIALAVSVDGLFITADEKLYEKANEIKNVKLLGDNYG